MEITKQLGNFLRYGSLNLIPQVDPEVMKPIFEENLSPLSFYSPEDYLTLQKTEKGNLIFKYNSKKQKLVWFDGTIYARRPGKYFGNGVLSYMDIKMVRPDNKGELMGAINNIVNAACIEEVVLSSLEIQGENANLLRKMGVKNPGSNLKDGLKLAYG